MTPHQKSTPRNETGHQVRKSDCTAPDQISAAQTRTQTARAFPIRVTPIDGEALDSWLEAIGQRLGAAWGDILYAAGLPSGAQVGATSWLTQLSPAQSAALSQATTQHPETLAAMTLARYDGSALRINSATATVSRAFPWSRGRYSRYCPHCLRETGGRWLLSWRLGWAFACPTHRCLLADHCPTCAQRQRERPTPTDLIPTLGTCTAPAAQAVGRAPARCTADLTAASTLTFPDDHPVLTAQRIINAAIDEGTTTFGIYHNQPVPPAHALTDIRAVAGRVLAYASHKDLEQVIAPDLHGAYSGEPRRPSNHSADRRRGKKPGLAAPAHALTTAVGVSAAMHILNSPTAEGAGENMRWLVTTARNRGLAVNAASLGWAQHTTDLLTATQLAALGPLLKPSDQLRFRTGSLRPKRPSVDSHTRRAAKLPAVLWPAWAVRLAPPHLDYQHLAQALPCAILLVNTKLTLTQASEQMTWPRGGRAMSHVLQQLQAHTDWEGIREAIIRLADYLDFYTSTIDYQRRRGLDYGRLLPSHRWQQLADTLRIPAVDDVPLAAARCHLYSTISANPARNAPWFINTKHFAATVTDFPALLTAPVAKVLEDEARTFLQHNHINEPVSWHPPTELLDGLALPGTDPRHIDKQQVHHLLQKALPLSAVARQLHVPAPVLRHVLAVHPNPQAAAECAKSNTAIVVLKRTLSASKLTDLYCAQRLSLRAIGARYEVSRQTVARLALDYGIELRKPHRPRQYDSVDRDWLHAEYTLNGRTLSDLAAEKGMSTANMRLWAQTYGIARRGRGRRKRKPYSHSRIG